jgi:hypothetical protein
VLHGFKARVAPVWCASCGAIPILSAKVIPKSDHEMAVLTAAEFLTNAAQHLPGEFARIGTLQALNRHAQRVFNPDRKTLRRTDGI